MLRLYTTRGASRPQLLLSHLQQRPLSGKHVQEAASVRVGVCFCWCVSGCLIRAVYLTRFTCTCSQAPTEKSLSHVMDALRLVVVVRAGRTSGSMDGRLKCGRLAPDACIFYNYITQPQAMSAWATAEKGCGSQIKSMGFYCMLRYCWKQECQA